MVEGSKMQLPVTHFETPLHLCPSSKRRQSVSVMHMEPPELELAVLDVVAPAPPALELALELALAVAPPSLLVELGAPPVPPPLVSPLPPQATSNSTDAEPASQCSFM